MPAQAVACLDSVLSLPRRIWWPWDQPCERVGFYRPFAVDDPADAILYVSASGPYAVWLDECPLPVPDAALPSWRAMHRFQVDLAPGAHTLTILAEPGGHGQPFLLACLDWESAGALTRLATDGQWRMAADPPASWPTEPNPGEDCEAWAFDGVWAEPWGFPCNAPLDFCRLSNGWQQVSAERLTQVVQLHQGLKAAGAAVQVRQDGAVEMRPVRPYPSAPPRIENLRPRPMWHLVREVHSSITNSWLDLFEARAPHAVFDAGAETFARVRVRLRCGGPAILALTTGESLPETERYDRRISDVFELDDGETFTTSPAGFRYLKVMALSAGDEPIVLDPVALEHIRYPARQVGAFTCSDPRLSEIWALCARTTHLCMQNEMWDGIKRDQLPWMGDLYVEALAAYHVFGDARLVRRSLAVLAEIGPAPARPLGEQRYPGLRAIWRTPGGEVNGIPSYTLWWVVGLADYYQYTGDRALIEELSDELVATLEHIAGHLDQDGRWRFGESTGIVDWAPLPLGEQETFCHLLACQAMGLGADLLHAIGRTDEGDAFRDVRTRMAEAARGTWWDGTSERTLGTSHHVHAMAIRSGLLSKEASSAHFRRTLEADPPYAMTYWHRYADLDAAARVGQVQWGLDYVRRHWGPALDLGMTALWEAFDPAWTGDDPHAVSVIGDEHAAYGGYRTSLCHAWSVGPAVWLHTAVLGVVPSGAGFAAIEFCPSLGDLEWAEGTVPTPRGPIRVALHRGQDDRPSARLEVPRDVAVHTPESAAQAWQIEVRTYTDQDEREQR